jgi:hypothetical protein
VSANLVTKTQIDLLVTAAVKWPQTPTHPFSYHWAGAGSQPVTAETADRVGQMLWLHNWEVTEGWVDREERSMADPPDYVYEPLAGVPDPLLVLKQISYYEYQSVDDDEEWLLGEPRAFLRSLQAHAQVLLPGMAELPWGIGHNQRGLFLELGGPDPTEPERPSLRSDPEREVLDQALTATGVPFRYSEQAVSLGRDGERALWSARSPGDQTPSVRVTLHDSEPTARATYDRILGDIRNHGHDVRQAVLRRGRVVVSLSHHPAIDAPEWWFDRVLAVFSDAEDRWVSSESIRAQAAATIIGTRVPLTRDGERSPSVASGAAIVARDRESLDALREMIDDPDLADSLSQVDLAQTSVILLPKVGSLELGGTVELADLGQLSHETAHRVQLNVGVDDVRHNTGTLLAVEALAEDLSGVLLKNNLRLMAMRP